MDHSITKYKLTGNIYIWKFKEPNPDQQYWNFTADRLGSDSLLQLIQLMLQSNYPSTKEIKTTIPTAIQTDVPNDRNIEWTTRELLVLKYRHDEPTTWKIVETENSLSIILGLEKMKELQNAILKLQKREQDFAIADGYDQNILYFWWNPER